MMKKFFLFILFGMLISHTATSQMSQFKALFLFNFAKNVEWPEHASGKNFTITIIGDTELADQLNELSALRKIGNKTLVIKEAEIVENIGDSHIIYLAASKSSLLPILHSYKKGNPVLLVADKAGLCSQGAGISFFTDGGKLKFEVSPRNLETQGLKVAQRLIALGTVAQ